MDIKDLIGLTITNAYYGEPKKDWDDEQTDDDPSVILEFDNGTSVEIDAGYGGYTGNSEGEYPTFLSMRFKDE